MRVCRWAYRRWSSRLCEYGVQLVNISYACSCKIQEHAFPSQSTFFIGKSLPISYNTYRSILQAATPPTMNVSATRSASSLESHFFSFDNSHQVVTGTTVSNSTPEYDKWLYFLFTSSDHDQAGRRSSICSYNVRRLRLQPWNWMADSDCLYNVSRVSTQLTGAKLFTNYVRHWGWPLIHSNVLQLHFSNINVAVVDTEEIIEAGFTGLSSKRRPSGHWNQKAQAQLQSHKPSRQIGVSSYIQAVSWRSVRQALVCSIKSCCYNFN